MHTLVLNAAEGLLQLVLIREEADAEPVILTAQEWHAPSQGAELLAPALEKALGLLGLTAGDITGIACVSGPGSFTGIRLTLATALGLALATGARMAGIAYLPLLAGRVVNELPDLDRDLWVITHARSNLVHMQGFDRLGRELTEILVLSPQEAVGTIAAVSRGKPVYLLGSGIARNPGPWRELMPQLPEQSRVLSTAFNSPCPACLARAAQGLAYSHKDIQPLYVRPSDAEENLAHIAAKLGLDPEAAEGRLADLTASLDPRD